MNGNSTLAVKVGPGGDQVVAHVGLHALGCLADRLGLGDALSSTMPPTGERAPLHDRGKVLVQTMLMLAGGGESCADIEHLRCQGLLFGPVPSDSTVYRTFRRIDPATLADLWAAIAQVRARVWDRSSSTSGADRVVLDVDASLVEIHSEQKAGTAATYKGGFGFHPIFCFADATGEALGVLLRPGNATANNAADNLAVVDAAVAQLPAGIALGHLVGDNPSLVARPVMVRSDSAGCTAGFVGGCRSRNIGFAVVARTNASIQAAISACVTDVDRWQPALRQDGTTHPASEVAEVTDLADLSAWPAGTRLIIRREPLHQGAQTSLFPSWENRYWGHYTDQAGEPATLDAHMRAHAHVEDNIRRLKSSGLERFPFSDLHANRAWLANLCWADSLVRWFQQLVLSGPLAVAEPKQLRWALWHTPARIVRKARRHIVRIVEGWPTAPQLLAAYQRLDRIA